uniref:Uncharacterized protein n=1 Tax=uncultured delta proteobacterium HF0200_39N20 TaxID=710833 RepID=E0XUS1_9DELT|nr:hypothetical protein [uncultured delta proteobacterium HF0200_39N20]
MNELLGALEKLENVHFVFTVPNADTDGRNLFKMIEKFFIKQSKLEGLYFTRTTPVSFLS